MTTSDAKNSYDLSPLLTTVTSRDIGQYLQSSTDGWWVRYGREIMMALVVAFALVTVVSGTYALVNDSGTAIAIGFFGLMSTAFCLVGLSQAKMEFTRQVRLLRLAEANGLSYQTKLDSSTYSGMIFTIGSAKRTTDVIGTGPEADLQFGIGSHTYTIGSGKNRRSYYWRYVCIPLNRRLPHMVLDSKRNNLSLFGTGISNLPATLHDSQRVQLEGDFGEYFQLYGPNGYDTDVRYIFTPDLMALLIDNAADYDVEVIDNMIYFYQRESYARSVRPQDMPFYEKAFKLIAAVGSKIDRQSDYYADDRVGDRVMDIVAPEGRRLKRGVSVVAIVAGALYLLFSLARIFLDL